MCKALRSRVKHLIVIFQSFVKGKLELSLIRGLGRKNPSLDDSRPLKHLALTRLDQWRG
jgi:hypothetical protein